MWACAAAGDVLDRSEGSPPSVTQAWPAQRTVRAAVLRHLLIDQERSIDPKGVRLRGLRIVGALDLQAATLRCPLWLDSCYVDAEEPICFDDAVAQEISFVSCSVPGLTGGLLVARTLDLKRSALSGPLLLRGADIAGYVNCRGVQIDGCDEYGDAFGADGIKASSIFLTEGFTAAGTVRLPSADIAKDLVCAGARLGGRDEDGYALIADQVKVGGTVLLDAGWTAGAISLGGAHVAGDLNCTGARLNGSDRRGRALDAGQLQVGGSVLLDAGFTAAGAVRMTGADIGGSLICSGARLSGCNEGGYSLLANEIRVGGSVFLAEGFSAAGAVGLHGASIARALVCGGARLEGGDVEGNVALRVGGVQVGSIYLTDGFNAAGIIWLRHARVRGSIHLAIEKPEAEATTGLDAAHAQIAGTFEWLPTARVEGNVSLQSAIAGQLDDDWSAGRDNGFWPTGGQLNLDGFTYGRLGGGHQGDVKQRLAWIRSQYKLKPKPTMPWADTLAAPVTISIAESPENFATQPYEQLATVYRQAGQDDQAREVAIARRRDLRKYGNLNWYRRFGNRFLDTTIRYGYHTWRAAVALAALFLIYWWLSVLAQQHHLIAWAGDIPGLHFVPSATKCASSYPCFYPFGYTVDTVIPLINVHQADFWGPDASTPWGVAFQVATWIATGLGWALATLLVAGYTGVVRRQ
jgi:hypothetical protein